MQNLREIKLNLEKNFKERDEEIAGALLSILSGENILFLGPPGTAKSLLALKLCESIDGGNFFYYLLTRFTTPDEIFGPLSIKSLQEDEFKRKIEGYIPTSHICFLDEIFKANSSILNSLLTLLNERKFHNGRELIDTPLLTVFAASNELPEEDESLEALYDRFLFRYSMGYIQDETNFRDLLLGDTEKMNIQSKITIRFINEIQTKANEAKIEEDVLDALLALRKNLRSMNHHISDRRWKKMLKALKIASVSIGRESVDRTMVPLLQHMTWDKPEQKDAIRHLLIDLTISGGVSLDKLMKDAEELKSLTEKSRDYTFPKTIETQDEKKEFNSWRELEEYVSKNPDETYNNPYSDKNKHEYNIRRFYFNDLIKELKENHSWNFGSTIPEPQLKRYKKEMNEIKEQFETVKEKIFSERERLKQLMETNIWLSHKDRHDIMMNYDDKIKTVHKVEETLKRIENGITVNEVKIEIPIIKPVHRNSGF
ncbi:MAG: AAA family ATPase [Candidatus Methanoperedens sp.]|nr:AAA family ATPase [Candidatus Methanoperedens sp.]MCZ7371638.1 AAA family ATPase [Candidatus Methanoperedens sp.]